MLILTHRLPECLKELDRLTRRAQRAGCPDISYRVGAEQLCETRVDDRKVKMSYTEVEIEGEAPVHAGYRMLAHVELSLGGAIIDIVPGHHVEERFRRATTECEHCQRSRRRTDLYIVEHVETGRQMQVGRSCLRDFLGIDDPRAVAARFALLRASEALGSGGGGLGWVHSVERVLELASAAARVHGWCSYGMARADGRLTPTASYVSLALCEPRGLGREALADRARVLDAVGPEDLERARQLVAWARGLEPSNEYEHNLQVLLSSDVLTDPRRLGIFVSSLGTVMSRERAERPRVESQWVGEVGERIRGLTVVVESTRVVPGGMYGDRLLVKMRGPEGQILSWFTGARVDLPSGEARLDATVKAHNEWRGDRETLVTRCKISS